MFTDPYTPVRGYFECFDCGRRVTTTERVDACKSCGGEVCNLAVARE